MAWEVEALAARSVEVILENQDAGGAFVAAPDFPPYAYCWLRDGAFIADALSRLGEIASAEAFFGWCARALESRADRVAELVRRRRAGEALGPEQHLPCRLRLDGSEGDADWALFQLDGYGAWLWALGAHAGAPRAKHRAVRGGRGDERPLRLGVLERALLRLVGGAARPAHRHACVDPRGAFGGRTLGRARRRAANRGNPDRDRGRAGGPGRGGRRRPARSRARRRPARCEPARVRRAVRAPRGRRPGARAHRPGARRRARPPRGPSVRGDSYYGGGEWALLAALLGLWLAAVGRSEEAWAQLDWIVAQASAQGDLPEQVSDHLLVPEAHGEWVARWGPPASPLLWSHAMFLTLAHELGAVGD